MGDIRVIEVPEGTERVETGPLQIGEDWPGVFLRGDDAMAHAAAMRAALDSKDLYLPARVAIERVIRWLESADISHPRPGGEG